MFWYHNNRMINYDLERGITVTTTPGRRTHSQLLIKQAEVADSGNYTCSPSNSLPASIQVFVSGEYSHLLYLYVKVQRGCHCMAKRAWFFWRLNVLCFINEKG